MSAHVKPADVTYLKDVAPILSKRCGGCHVSGAIAPALDSYEHARTWARAIKEEVLQQRMPPWSAASGLGDFSNDPRPTPIEAEILTAWADGGTPQGSDSLSDDIALRDESTSAIVVPLPSAHPSRGGSERVRVPLGDQHQRTWIGGWEFRPGDPRAIEQAVFFADEVRIGSWVAPDSKVTFPGGVSLSLRRGAMITAELRYRKSTEGRIDTGTLLLYPGAAGAEPRYRAFACGATVLRQDVKALTVMPSAAEAGASVEVVARRPDNSVEPLVALRRYLPAYPSTYRFRTPIALPRGTVIDVRSSARECTAGIDFIASRPGRAVSLQP